MMTGNLSEYLSQQAKEYPDKPVFLHPELISFSQFEDQVNGYAHGFNGIGIKPGMKVILLLKTSPDFFAMVFALFRIGAVLVLIDPGVGHKVMKSSLKSVQADVFMGIPKAHLFRMLYRKAFSKIPILITMGNRWFWGGYKTAKLCQKQSSKFPVSQIDPNQLEGIFFTSGSTGAPKGVLYQNRMFHAQISFFKTHYQWSPKEIDLCTFPLIGLFSICMGCSVVIADMDPIHPASLSPAKIWKNLEEFQCTHMFASPLVLKKIGAYGVASQKQLSSLKRIVSAGAPLSVELLKQVKSILPKGGEIHTPYGATECLPITDVKAEELIQLKEEGNTNLGVCVGRPLPEIDIQIIEISDQPLPLFSDVKLLGENEIGEIMVKGPVVSESYLDNAQANAKAKVLTSSGEVYHRMGDVGKKDAAGRIWFYGRKNHRVETNNKTLFSIPTEALFNQNPAVARTAIVGLEESDGKGIICGLCIEPIKRPSKVEKQELIIAMKALAKENELNQEIRHYFTIDSFPVDPRHNAKIFREKLKEWAQKKIN